MREARLAGGRTQEELASRTRLNRTALAKVESGTRRIDALELRALDAFASELRLPAAVVRSALVGRTAEDRRSALVDVAGRWRTSWSLAVRTAARVMPLPDAERVQLASPEPVKADFIAALGREPEPDLAAAAAGPQWRQAVLAAHGNGAITGSRAVELLRGLVDERDLAEPPLPEHW